MEYRETDDPGFAAAAAWSAGLAHEGAVQTQSAEARARSQYMHVTSVDELERALSMGQRSLVLFGAKWCPACRAIVPRMKRLAKKHPEVVWVIVHHSKATNMDAAFSAYNINQLPTLTFFDENGRPQSSEVIEDAHSFEVAARSKLARLDFQP